MGNRVKILMLASEMKNKLSKNGKFGSDNNGDFTNGILWLIYSMGQENKCDFKEVANN